MDGGMQDKAISARKYALDVVGKIEGGGNGAIWAGTQSFAVRLCMMLPQSILVSDEFLRCRANADFEV